MTRKPCAAKHQTQEKYEQEDLPHHLFYLFILYSSFLTSRISLVFSCLYSSHLTCLCLQYLHQIFLSCPTSLIITVPLIIHHPVLDVIITCHNHILILFSFSFLFLKDEEQKYMFASWSGLDSMVFSNDEGRHLF